MHSLGMRVGGRHIPVDNCCHLMPVTVRVTIDEHFVDTHINRVRMSDTLNVEDVDRAMAAAASSSGAGGSNGRNDHQVQHHASRCECFPLRTLSALRIPFSRWTPLLLRTTFLLTQHGPIIVWSAFLAGSCFPWLLGICGLAGELVRGC